MCSPLTLQQSISSLEKLLQMSLSDYDRLGPGPSGLKSADLRSYAWYHGKITRLRSEQILLNDGDFLVRDSISSPGDYVLTAFWKGKSMHFQVNVDYVEGKKVYQFEEEQFTSVADLIEFYRVHDKPVTMQSQCSIRSPVAPGGVAPPVTMKELEASYAHVFRPGTQPAPAASLKQQVLMSQALRARTPRPQSSIDALPPNVNPHAAFDRFVEHRTPAPPINRPLPIPVRSPRVSNDDYDDLDYDQMEDVLDASSRPHTPASVGGIDKRSSSSMSLPGSSLSSSRFTSSPHLAWRTPPALPSRPKEQERDSGCHMDDPLDYDEPKRKEKPPVAPKPTLPSQSDYDDLARLTVDVASPRSSLSDADLPRAKIASALSDYDALPNRNSSQSPEGLDYDKITTSKPPRRDSGVFNSASSSPPDPSAGLCQRRLHSLQQLLLDEKCERIAALISAHDAHIINMDESSKDAGLRLILLPSGRGVRSRLLERSRSLQLALLLSLLSSTRREAPTLLAKWIHVEQALMAGGNVYGWANLHTALESDMVTPHRWLWCALDDSTRRTWETLRCAFIKLRRTGASPSPVSIPFLQPILELFSSDDTQYLNTETYSAEIDSLWKWLSLAREWPRDIGKMSAVCKSHQADRVETRNVLDSEALAELLFGTATSVGAEKFLPLLTTLREMSASL